MAGKFINTQQKTTVNSLVDGFKQKLNNPYYKLLAPASAILCWKRSESGTEWFFIRSMTDA